MTDGMNLDFTGLDILSIHWKMENGVQVTEEERKLCEEWDKRKEKEEKRKILYAQQQPLREAANRNYAIKCMEEKFCPFISGNCIGEKCAMMKVLEKPREACGVSNPDKQYEAMCAFNIPDRGTRIVYGR